MNCHKAMNLVIKVNRILNYVFTSHYQWNLQVWSPFLAVYCSPVIFNLNPDFFFFLFLLLPWNDYLSSKVLVLAIGLWSSLARVSQGIEMSAVLHWEFIQILNKLARHGKKKPKDARQPRNAASFVNGGAVRKRTKISIYLMRGTSAPICYLFAFFQPFTLLL